MRRNYPKLNNIIGQIFKESVIPLQSLNEGPISNHKGEESGICGLQTCLQICPSSFYGIVYYGGADVKARIIPVARFNFTDKVKYIPSWKDPVYRIRS